MINLMRTTIIKKIAVCCGLALLAGAASAAQERFRKSPPIPEPLAKLELPSIESVRLSNGLTVASAFGNNHPFISLELVCLLYTSDAADE